MTFQQAKAQGGCVRQGQKGELVVYASMLTCKENETSEEDAEKTVRFMKGYTVFNVEQIDGLPSHYYELATPTLSSE